MVKFIKYLSRDGWKIFVLTLTEEWFEGSANNYGFYLPDGIKVIRFDPPDLFNLSGRVKQKLLNRKNTSGSGSNVKPPGNSNSSTPEKGGFFHEVKEFVTGLLQYPDRYNGFSLTVFRRLKKILKENQIDYVLASSPPHSVNIPLNFLRRFSRFVYIADFRDPWALSQWDVENETPIEKLYRRLDRYFERRTIKRADVVIFNTEFLKNLYVNHYASFGSLDRKGYVIPNGFDPEIRSNHREGTLVEYNSESSGKIRILHTGTLYKKRNPQIILEGLAAYTRLHPEQAGKIEITFVGTVSPTLSFLHDLIEKLHLTKQVSFQPSLPYQEVMERSKQADWLLLLQPGTSVQVPAKFFDYLLVNKPIWGVLEVPSVGQKMIEELRVGYVSDCQSLDTIVSFFEYLTLGRNHRLLPDEERLESYSMPHLVKQFEEILDKHALPPDA